eukprot:TRINITY_DN3124_c0_g2_i9.p2 TRINITY_DN3124_c0_g2~~TRINITY_DN3124_c0_g2_i9.p2  ORF type:complete len:206 (-),score=69.79 TRINITY_DN3124_c0_g2_i9:167-784(-)
MFGSQEVKKLGADLLFHAIVHGNTQEAIALLEDDEADINCTNINGKTPLHYAVEKLHLGFVEIFLKYGANPNVQDSFDVGLNTPLHKAAEHNQLEIIKLLLSAGAHPSMTNKTGFTPLHMAARGGHKDAAVLLLSAGADPNIRDRFGNNAAFWAKELGHEEVLKVLPKPASITLNELYEYKMQVQKVLGKGEKKKKGKKGKKGKK